LTFFAGGGGCVEEEREERLPVELSLSSSMRSECAEDDRAMGVEVCEGEGGGGVSE
jgi:hypothetical protein